MTTMAAAGVLLSSTPLALAWLAAAFGLGWPLARLLVPESRERTLQLGLGVALLLVADAALGAAGLLSGAGAWVLTLAGGGLALEQVRREGGASVRHLLPWPALPALAVLVLAACSAPGWLWASEFGGYDAMSYHLQLPKEWLALGRIEPLEHNVYSFLPGYVEAGYLHLMVLAGDALDAVYACQLLHAFLAVACAVAAGRVAASMAGPLAGTAAACLVLGTPWVVVVGSLAYNEMATSFMLAAGLLVVRSATASWRSGAALGLLAAAACGAKLTAIGFVALPLAIVMLMAAPPRRWLPLGAAAGLVALAGLLPWLVRNALHAGNPLFPFATGLLGEAHWTPGQAEIFMQGHRFQGGPAARLAELWNQVLRYGIGPRPEAGEPWAPQWSLLPWLAIGGLAATRLRGHALHLGAVLGVQLLFWLLATHLKSRFLVPAAVPAAIAAALGLSLAAGRAGVAVKVALLLWCALPVLVLSNEPYTNRARGPAGQRDAPLARIGAARVISGDALAPAERRALSDLSAVVTVNWLLEADRRVLLVGQAAPLYFRGSFTYQTTWDRGPLSRAMDRAGDGAEAWVPALREAGYTHLLVDPTMLGIWSERGWGDPRLTAPRILDGADRLATRLAEYPDGTRLYALARE